MDKPEKKSAKEQIKALHQAALAKAKEAEQRRNRRRARRDADEPPEEEDTQAQAMVRRYCNWESSAGMWEPDNTGYSDYSGSFVERANAEYWMTNYDNLFEQVHGGYGTVWTGIPHDNLLNVPQHVYERLEGDFQSLEDYPVLDEDRMSEMEFNAKQEYWNEYGREELRKELIQQAGYDVLAHLAAVYLSDAALNDLFRENDMDENLEIETGGSVYFRAERAAEGIPVDFLIEMGSQEPRIAGAEKKALLKQWPDFLDVVAEVLGPDYADKLAGLSDDHAYGLFLKLKEKSDDEDGLWSLDEDKHEDPSENLDLDLNAVKRVLVHVNDDLVRASRPEDPRQMRFPLFNGEAMNAQDIVSDLLEGFKEKKAAFIAAGADPQAVEQAITQFKALKARRMLSPEESDIDRYASFEDLQALLQQALGRTRSPMAPKRKITVRDDAELIHDDENVTIVVPNTYEASKFYGAGTKWCIASADYPGHFANYRKDLAKHYMFLFKNRPSSDRYYKVALTVYPGRRMAHDAPDQEIPLSEFKEHTGFDPNDPMFTPWDWRKMPSHERWKVAKRETGMTFAKFVNETDEATWDQIGQRVSALKQQWEQGQKTDAESKGEPEPSEEQLEQNWVAFWREARNEVLQDPNDKDYLDTLQYYVDLTESKNLAATLADLLLEGLLKEGAVKDWIMSITDLGHVRRELARVKGPFHKGADEPYQAAGNEAPAHTEHGPLA